MPPDPRQWREAERWLVRADQDIRSAAALRALSTPEVEPAAFHCQHAAEKMAKAAQIAARQPPPRVHDIDELARRVQAHFPSLGTAFEVLGGTTRWYASVRYPDAVGLPVPSAVEVRDVLARLRDLRGEFAGLAPGVPGD